jgi:DNA invertase Pin-like site-specific DNA recombinase
MIAQKFDPNRPCAYVRYARMSTDTQNPRSPEQQFDEINRALQRLRWPWRHLGDYRDDGVSGRYLTKRAGLMQLLQDVKTGKVKADLILVDTLERFGRMRDVETVRRALHVRYGVLILTADSGFADPTSIEGQALGIVEAIRSTQDARVKAHNVLRGKRDAAKLGHWPGGPPPWGYKLESVMTADSGPVKVAYRRLIPDPDAAAAVTEIFRVAFDHGWGDVRIAKLLNADKALVTKWGRFHPDTIGRLLSNPIYRGELVYGRLATDVVEDRRVIHRNTEDDIVRVPNFCEPLVSNEVWEKLQQVRCQRGDAIRRSRARGRPDAEKQIRPLAPGMTLKYALSGLVRCGVCGASMRPNQGGGVTKKGKRYAYYNCPSHHAGSCSNGLYCPEHWLRKQVFAAVRRRLFPSPDATSSQTDNDAVVPAWFPELVTEVETELGRIATEQQAGRRPDAEQEIKALKDKLTGWTQSLANPNLPVDVRRAIEQEFEQAITRQRELEYELAAMDDRARATKKQLDPNRIVECLHRLNEVMANANPTLANMELSRHIDRIEVFPDGKVIMHTCRLGVFEGLVTMLARPAEETAAHTENSDTAVKNGGVLRVRPRLRAKLRVNDGALGQTAAAPSAYRPEDPRRFDGLSANWFWHDEFEMPRQTCWAAEHAAEVAKLRGEGWTMAKLVQHFGVSRPTIRHALKLAADGDSSGVAAGMAASVTPPSSSAA